MSTTQKYRVDLPDGTSYEVEVPDTPQSAADELTRTATQAARGSTVGRALYRPFEYATETVTAIPEALIGVGQRGKQIQQSFPEAGGFGSKAAAALETIGNMIVGPAKQTGEKILKGEARANPFVAHDPFLRDASVFAEALPLIGPMFTGYREKIEKGEGVEAGVDFLMDMASMLVGGGGVKSGQALTKKSVVPSGAIPGANQFAVEAPKGTLGRIALGKTGTPSGGELAAQRIKARNPAIQRELVRQGEHIGPVVDVIGTKVQSSAQKGLQVADEQAAREALERAREFGGTATSREGVGQQVKDAVSERVFRSEGQDPNILKGTTAELKPFEQRRTVPQKDVNAPEGTTRLVPPTYQAGQATQMGKKPPKIGDIETKLWEPLNERGAGIGATMEKTKQVVAPLQEASQEQIISASKLVSPKTQKIIKDLAEAKSDPSVIANQFLSMTDEQLARLPGRLGEEARDAMNMYRSLQQQGVPDADIVNSMSIFQRGEWQRYLRDPNAPVDVPQTQVFWKQLHEARQEIDGALKGMSRDVLGTPEARILRQIRDAMTEDMRHALRFDPDLVRQFDKANAFTKMRHEVYGKGATKDMLKREGGTPPSAIVNNVFGGTPEEARRVRQAIGNDPDVLAELRTAITDELFERSKTPGASGHGTVNYAKAHDLLTDKKTGEVMREVLGTGRYAKLLDDVKRKIPSKADEALTSTLKGVAGEAPEKAVGSVFKPNNDTAIQTVVNQLDDSGKAGFQRAAYQKLIDDNVPHHGVVDGPKLAAAYREHRGALKASGVPEERLKALDDMFAELDKYKLTQGFDPDNPKSMIGALTETGVATKVGMSAVAGNLLGAIGGIGYLFTPKALLRILLEPEGPNAFVRGLQTGKITGPLTRIIGHTAKAGGAAQMSSVPLRAQGNISVSEEDAADALMKLKGER